MNCHRSPDLLGSLAQAGWPLYLEVTKCVKRPLIHAGRARESSGPTTRAMPNWRETHCLTYSVSRAHDRYQEGLPLHLALAKNATASTSCLRSATPARTSP